MLHHVIAKVHEVTESLRRTARRLGDSLERSISVIRLAGCGGVVLILLSLSLVLWMVTDEVTAALVSGGDVRDARRWAELVGLHVLGLLIVALVLELGPALARRLKKIGPVELFAHELHDILPEVRQVLQSFPDVQVGPEPWDRPVKLNEEARYRTERADALLYYVEFAEARTSRVVREPDLWGLLLQMAGVALQQHHWTRALDRLKLLAELSGGTHEPEETQKRTALAALMAGEASSPTLDGTRRHRLFREAARAAREAMKLDPGDWRTVYYLGTANYRLNQVGRARDLFLQTLKLFPRHAPSKYNLACAYAALGDKERALSWLEGLSRDDVELKVPLGSAAKDPDLDPLRKEPWSRRELERILEIKQRLLDHLP